MTYSIPCPPTSTMPVRRWTRHTHPPTTINELCDRHQAWADEYYQKPTRDGSRRPTREALSQRDAMRALRLAPTDPQTPGAPLIGELAPHEFCAELLCICQDWMVSQGTARKEINKRTQRIRRVFKWAAKPPRRWVGPEIVADLTLVEALKIGRTPAPERPPVTSAPNHLVTALQVHLAEQQCSEDAETAAKAHELATMLDLHLHTGMRTGELPGMRRSELHRQDGWMIYQPGEHKTQHHGKDRLIFLGPIAQRIVADWLRRLDASPATAGRDTLWRWTSGELYREQVNAAFEAIYPPPEPLARRRRKARGRKRTRWETKPEWKKRLGPAKWRELLDWQAAHRFTPGQIRHSFATRLERLGGKDGERAAQKLLSHSDLRTTQIYIDPEMQAALELLKQVG